MLPRSSERNGRLIDHGDPTEAPAAITPQALVRNVLDKHFANGAHLAFTSDGEFRCYDGKHWAVLPEIELLEVVVDELSDRPAGVRLTTILRDASELLKVRCSAKGAHLSLARTPAPVVNCSNGEVWIGRDGSLDLRPHDPESFLSHSLRASAAPSRPARPM